MSISAACPFCSASRFSFACWHWSVCVVRVKGRGREVGAYFVLGLVGACFLVGGELFLLGGTGAREEDLEFFRADHAFEMSFAELVLAEDLF